MILNKTTSCEGKIKYKEEWKATNAAKLLATKSGDGNLSTYHCEFCGKYHVGHVNKGFKKLIIKSKSKKAEQKNLKKRKKRIVKIEKRIERFHLWERDIWANFFELGLEYFLWLRRTNYQKLDSLKEKIM